MLKRLLKRARAAAVTNGKAVDSGEETVKATVAESAEFDRPLDLIVVPQSAIDALETSPDALIEAVVDYVNFLFQEAHFTRFEISPEAVQLYHCDYYLAQVEAGGHARFVASSAEILAYTLDDMLSGLNAAQANDHHELVQDLSAWLAENPNEIDALAGREKTDVLPLTKFDGPFADIQRATPLRECLARWIKSVEVLQVVDDAVMPQVLEGIKSLNPRRHERLSKSRITKLINQLSNPVHVGIGMAGASLADPAPIISIDTGAAREIDGEMTKTWRVQTADGPYFAAGIEGAIQLRDYVVQSDDDEAAATITGHGKVAIGPVVNQVTGAQINAARKICADLHAAVAIEMLVSKLPDPTTVDFASVRSASPDANGVIGASLFLVADKGQVAYTAVIDTNGARLLSEPEHEIQAVISATELADHIEKISEAA